MRFVAPIAALVLLTFTSFAIAQSSSVRSFPLSGKPRAQTISVSFRFALPGSAGSADSQAKMSADGRRKMYALIAKECDILLETIAQSCRLLRANVHSNIRRRGSAGQTININANATFQIEMKTEN